MLQHVVRRMTEAEFLDWQLDQPDRYELVDGEPRAMTGARIRHDRLVVNAMAALQRRLRDVGSPCEPFSADIAVRVPNQNLRRPDVTVYCQPLDEDALVLDCPRLVIEVLSETTQDTDHFVKLEEYKNIAVLDYIILFAPKVVDALVWSRTQNRAWTSTRYRALTDFVPMPTLGIILPLAEVYERVVLSPRPPRLVSDG